MIKAKTLQDLFKRYRRPGDLVFAVVALVFSLAMAVSLPFQTTWVARGGLLSQPAFWPYAAVYTMLGFSVLHLISSLVSTPLEGRWAEVRLWARSLEFAGWFLAYVVLVPILGYLPATVIFCVSLAFRVGYRSRAPLIWAAALGVVVVVVFRTFLQVKVPGGALYELLPGAARSFMLTYF